MNDAFLIDIVKTTFTQGSFTLDFTPQNGCKVKR